MSPSRDGRIVTRKGFAEVLAARQALSSPYLRVSYLTCKGEPRLGLAVARKLTRTSVQRNRLRRRLAESFRRDRARLGDTRVVARLRRPCLDLPSARTAAREFAGLLATIAGRER